MACIGEHFSNGDDICGVVVNMRKNDRLSIWTKTANNEAVQVVFIEIFRVQRPNLPAPYCRAAQSSLWTALSMWAVDAAPAKTVSGLTSHQFSAGVPIRNLHVQLIRPVQGHGHTDWLIRETDSCNRMHSAYVPFSAPDLRVHALADCNWQAIEVYP